MPPKTTASTATTTGKAPGLWDRSDFLMDLSIALYQVADFNGALNAQIKGAVAEYLNAQGHEIGWDAIRQHVQKLRKNRDTSGIQAASGASSKTSTPRKTNGTGRKRATPSKKCAIEDMSQEDDDEELVLKKEEYDVHEEMAETPQRANKRVKRTAVSEVKFEDGEF